MSRCPVSSPPEFQAFSNVIKLGLLSLIGLGELGYGQLSPCSGRVNVLHPCSIELTFSFLSSTLPAPHD